ncbi:S1 RNA-binding domain-containing protein [Viridibacillus arvi]|uniref:S1 RNA-binding domain-containing protein n=1 Tax=Viridibacillus arvi TaxID=263475 RepID=UPI003D00536A
MAHAEDLQALQGVLIEGFSPEKVLENERQRVIDKHWKDVYNAFQNNLILSAEVKGIENISGKSCAICELGTIRVNIPAEHSGTNNINELRYLTGRVVNFKILNFDRENEIVIGSRLEAKKQSAEITLRNIKVGDTIHSVVQAILSNALIVDIGGIETKISPSEIRYGWINNIHDEARVGDHIKVKVLAIDKEKQDVKVSIKQTLPNPWQGQAQRYLKGNEYVGKVSGITEYGIFVNLTDGVDSLANHMKFEDVKIGERVLVRVLNISAEREQMTTKIVRKM